MRPEDSHSERLKRKLPQRPVISGMSDRMLRSAYGDLSDLERQLQAYGKVTIGSEMEYYLLPQEEVGPEINIVAMKEQKRREALAKAREALKVLGVPEDKLDTTLRELADFSAFNKALDDTKKPLAELT